MSTVADRLKQYGIILNKNRIEVTPVHKQIVKKESELEHAQNECDRLNKYYWNTVIPKMKSVENPPEVWKQKERKIHSELEQARKKLESLQNG